MSLENFTFTMEPAALSNGVVPKKSTRIDDDEVTKRTHAAMARDMPSVQRLKDCCYGETAIICGGGPSLADNLGTIRKLYKKRKHKLICTNKTHDYMVKHNFRPWSVVLLDPMPWVADYVKLGTPKTKVFIAAQCHKDTFEAVKKYDPYVWHAAQNETHPVTMLRRDYPRGPWEVIGTGNTGGLRAIELMYWRGFRRFRLFGYDSSMRNGSLYAYDKKHAEDAEEGPATLKMNGHEEEFFTNEHMARQVELFERMIELISRRIHEGIWEPIDIRVYGDGMLPSIAAGYGLHADPAMNEKWATKEEQQQTVFDEQSWADAFPAVRFDLDD